MLNLIQLGYEYFKLDIYLDVFDSLKLLRLKQVARLQGIGALIDAVVQTAYLAGYQGNNDKAQSYLDKALLHQDLNKNLGFPLEKCAEIFLSHVLSMGNSAHTFLKSCLSYYAVSKKGHNMSHASRLLSISRTTLNEHLRIANQLGVCEFLEGSINIVSSPSVSQSLNSH
ncbi:MAG: hypothetical protein K2X39_08565 [Silvanigrellaceae bacterium]|nr:hypothetical protein [Silvanigrellaceae bacterium]